jgi:hypothetical protein
MEEDIGFREVRGEMVEARGETVEVGAVINFQMKRR